jgi:hypothetical protein
MIEAVRTSETVYLNSTARHYIPEGSNLHIRRRENLKFATGELFPQLNLCDILYTTCVGLRIAYCFCLFELERRTHSVVGCLSIDRSLKRLQSNGSCLL